MSNTAKKASKAVAAAATAAAERRARAKDSKEAGVREGVRGVRMQLHDDEKKPLPPHQTPSLGALPEHLLRTIVRGLPTTGFPKFTGTNKKMADAIATAGDGFWYGVACPEVATLHTQLSLGPAPAPQMRSLLMKHINAGLQTQKRDEAAAECAAQERLERRRKAAEVEAVRKCVRCQQSWDGSASGLSARYTTTGAAAATLAHVQHVAMSEDEWKERMANEMVKQSKERALTESWEKLSKPGLIAIMEGKITAAEFYTQIEQSTGIDLSAGMKSLNEIEADDPVTEWYTARKKTLSTAAAPPQHQPETCLWTFTLGASTFSAFPTFADGGKGGEKGEGRGSGGFEFIVPDNVAPAFLAAHLAAAASDVSLNGILRPSTRTPHSMMPAGPTHAYVQC